MQIGALKLENDIILAPLAGITNLPFRLMAKASGCGLVCSEMVSANGLIHRSPKTLNMLATEPAEKPLSIQIFGSEPSIMADAAAMVEASGADIIDINFGCSVRKVVKTGAGVALMRTPGLAEDIIKAVRASVRIPLTIKIRTGWTASAEQALRISQIAEDCGVDAVSVHPRTAAQRFEGQADWAVIAGLKKRLQIPVIGNGDIRQPGDADRMRAQTGCDAVMIGRRAIGFPWIFSQIKALFEGREPQVPELAERFDLMEDYARTSVRCMGEKMACRVLRSRLCWFVKGLPHNSKFRENISRLQSESEAVDKIRLFEQQLLHSASPGHFMNS
jgi:nifR3 family TIM-barrel protein